MSALPEHTAISLTFGDRAENHAGMQILGEEAKEGFTKEDLLKAQVWWGERGYKTELVALHEDVMQNSETQNDEMKNGEEDETKESPFEPAYVLIVRNAEEGKKDADAMFHESYALDVDKKAFMRGRVVNKRARYNVCFGPDAQEPDYEAKKGRIVAFRDVPLLDTFRRGLTGPLGEKAGNLMGELNLYYDTNKCGIGFHGDTERRIVVCVRLGTSIPLEYQWFHRSKPVGKRISLTLHHGDVYIMSAKAVGYDWKRSSKYTLRHAAGCKKYLTIVEKKKKQKVVKKRKSEGGDVNTRVLKK